MLDTLWAILSMQIFSQIGERGKNGFLKVKPTQSAKDPIFDWILPLKSHFFNVLRFG